MTEESEDVQTTRTSLDWPCEDLSQCAGRTDRATLKDDVVTLCKAYGAFIGKWDIGIEETAHNRAIASLFRDPKLCDPPSTKPAHNGTFAVQATRTDPQMQPSRKTSTHVLRFDA